METKVCSKCGRELPIEEFHKDSSKVGGYRNQCKECVKQYHKNNKDKIAEYYKQYYQENKEKIKQYQENNKDKISEQSKQYYQKNRNKILEQKDRDKVAEYNKQYYHKNKDKIAIHHKQYWDSVYRFQNRDSRIEYMKQYNKQYNRSKINKEKMNEYQRRYKKANRDKINIKNHRRSAKEKELVSMYTFQEWKDAKEYFNNSCAYCGKELPLTQDHFIPVSKGGEYTRNNIIPACVSCNSSKRDRDFFQWYPNQTYYSKKREKKILEYLGYENNAQQLALTV